MAKLEKYQMYIGGEWTDPASGEWFESINPFTGKPWALFARGNADDAGHAVVLALRETAGTRVRGEGEGVGGVWGFVF